MKIFCIKPGINLNLNNLIQSQSPIFYLKPDTSLLRNNEPFYIPHFTNYVECELQIVYRICKVGKNVATKFAHRYFDAIALGVNLIAKDLLDYCKINGLPWEIANTFDNSLAISSFFDKTTFKNLNNINFSLYINEKKIQEASSSNFSKENIISYISQFYTLKTGDYFCIAPPNILPTKINIGDKVEAFLENNKVLSFLIR
jgi:2-keto-4-pentenoate hydratase/2-oxohepta-3-ene-1,7-dioic acid hydratase in catechol pathway